GAGAACHDRGACFGARPHHLGDLLCVRGPRDGKECMSHEGGVVRELLRRVAGQNVLGADDRPQPAWEVDQWPRTLSGQILIATGYPLLNASGLPDTLVMCLPYLAT